MGGFFGTVAKAKSCVADLFYGTDYNSHLGTKRGGMATYDTENSMFTRSIHNLESTYFRTKFEDELDKFKEIPVSESLVIQTLNPLFSTPTLAALPL